MTIISKPMFSYFCYLQLSVFQFLFINSNFYKLPTSVMPQHYNLKILVDLDNEFKFSGTVDINVKTNERTSEIILHSKSLRIQQDDINIKETMEWFDPNLELLSNFTNNIEIGEFRFDDDKEFLIIDAFVDSGKTYIISIHFEGELNRNSRGFYRSSYIENGEKFWLAATEFEPTFARMAFPCFDEPSFKSTFSIKIGRLGNYNSFSNMPISEIKAMEDRNGWYWDIFEKTPKMPTYAVAFAISDFQFIHVGDFGIKNVPIRVWSRNGTLHQYKIASEVALKIYSQLEDYFSSHYPLPKIDFMAIPNVQELGASETWGLLTFQEYDIVDTNPVKDEILIIISHQAVHQWLNLVTIKWWDQIWLKKSLPNVIIETELDKVKTWDSNTFLSMNLFNYFKRDHTHSIPTRKNVDGSLKSILKAYDHSEKGTVLMRMLTNLIGLTTFRNGLVHYLNENRFGDLDEENFLSALEKIDGRNISLRAFLETWLYESGYPLVEVNRNYESRTASISQTEFFEKNFVQLDFERRGIIKKWWIEMSFLYRGMQKKMKAECSNEKSNITGIPPDVYLLVNVDMEAPIRVNYDDRNWKLITDGLKSEDFGAIPVLARNRLVDDVCLFAQMGLVKYELFFNFLSYLKDEILELPWQSALTQFESLDIQLRQYPIHSIFEKYMRFLLYSQFERLRTRKNNSVFDEYYDHSNAIMSDSCKFGIKKCLDIASKKFPNFFSNIRRQSLYTMRDFIFNYGIQRSNSKYWEDTLKLMKQLESKQVKQIKIYLSALSFTKDIKLLEKLMNLTMNSDENFEEYDNFVFRKILENKNGFKVAKEFLFSNLETLYQKNVSRENTFLKDLANYISKYEDYEELKNLMNNENFNVKFREDISSQIFEATQIVEMNIKWHKKRYHEVERGLHSFFKTHEANVKSFSKKLYLNNFIPFNVIVVSILFNRLN
ncbi:hypothetical protein HHI36_002824 [Cryptolaemus montrouzieri]|uniref:Aminopeptidase n=1 Tax=Cryptolaemus montrouzieri TaxID=559131 RepID=A0ABD2PBM9_9CUCU